LLSSSGAWLPVEDLCDAGVEEPVYNVRIADYHTYFVASPNAAAAVWAHNACNTHHIMTNKNKVSKAAGGPYTPKFERLAKQRGITLEHARNKMGLSGHQGPHPEYNRLVYERMSAATDGLKGRAYNKAFDAELARIKRLTRMPGTRLNRLATGG
jgi:hypothetical protein